VISGKITNWDPEMLMMQGHVQLGSSRIEFEADTVE
jgi:hypothetical protein